MKSGYVDVFLASASKVALLLSDQDKRCSDLLLASPSDIAWGPLWGRTLNP